jgi:hypothetical protein
VRRSFHAMSLRNNEHRNRFDGRHERLADIHIR